MDVDSIALGQDFRHILRERLDSCDLMLALIGPGWLDAKDAAGNRRLESATDLVRQEIAAALGVSLADVQTMDARLSGNDASLQAPSVSGDAESAEKMDFLVSDEPLPDEQVSNMIDGERRRIWLASALKHLNEREMKIISE